MLFLSHTEICERLFELRKQLGWNQIDVAMRAGISERTYADIERGKQIPKIDTFMRICTALHVTPNDVVLSKDENTDLQEEELVADLRDRTPQQQKTALRLLEIYLQSLK